MKLPLVSVVIPTHNRVDKLSELLHSLTPELQDMVGVPYEIITSWDGPIQPCEVPESMRTLMVGCHGVQGGPARTRNRGASYASSPLLVFIDDDCVAAPNCLRTYLEAYQSHPHDVLEGRTTTRDIRKSLADVAPLNETGGFLWSCNFAISADIFRSLGGFDPRFPYPTMEDVEFRTRVLKAGISIRFLADAVVYHGLRQRSNWAHFKHHLFSEDLFESLHPESRRPATAHWYMAGYGLAFHTLPGILRFRGAGMKLALRDHVFFLWAGMRKMLRFWSARG
jgi:GT2 family glycosyltransferase